jgi:hypothetical protein
MANREIGIGAFSTVLSLVKTMTKMFQKLVLAAGLSVGMAATWATQAQAISFFNFTVTPDSGPLNGAVYTGNFSFDGSGLSNSGDESVALSSFNFSFLGNTYSEADDPFAIAAFFDGNFLGIDYSFSDGTTAFSFLSGQFTQDINDAFFSYDIAAGPNVGAGFGDVSYTAVPTPALLPGLLGLGVAALRRRQTEQG